MGIPKVITFIEHVPSGKTWTTENPVNHNLDKILIRKGAGCLRFIDEHGRTISLPPKIVKECIFEVYQQEQQ